MGLASKLAAAQAGSSGFQSQPAQQQPGQASAPGGYPGQQSYQPYNPGAFSASAGPQAGGNYHVQQPPQGYQQQQQQSQQFPPPQQQPPHRQQQQQPPPPPQLAYNGAPQQSQAPMNANVFKQMLLKQIQERNLQNFYFPNSPAIDQIAQRAAQHMRQFCAQWRLPIEVGSDLCKLGLYDIVLFIDNSGSMIFEEDGERIKDLKEILTRVSGAATLFDDDGISIRVMNDDRNAYAVDNIKTEAQVTGIMGKIQFNNMTPLGTELRKKVIDPMVIKPAQNRALKKPVLLIAITDGQPAGEPAGTVHSTLRNANQELNRIGIGSGALACQFAQVGNDEKARRFLAELDSDASIGDFVDCTSNYESESAEMMKKSGIELTPELWLLKMLLGAIDSSYDDKDEEIGPQGGVRPNQPVNNPVYAAPQGYPPQQNSYGYQQGSYPPSGPPPSQPSGYGASGPGGYGPPQGGYAPPPGAPQGYSQQPPQQPPYPQQQQYQQPPPPPRY